MELGLTESGITKQESGITLSGNMEWNQRSGICYNIQVGNLEKGITESGITECGIK